jgi:hypothetical protein
VAKMMEREAVQRALRERPYVLVVPEQRQLLFEAAKRQGPGLDYHQLWVAIQEVCEGMHLVTPADTREGRRGKDEEDGKGDEGGSTLVDLGPEADPGSALDAEVDQVLNHIRTSLLHSLEHGGWKASSSPETNEFYAVVLARYPAAVDRAVLEEVRDQYRRAHSLVRPARPFLRSFFRYNVNDDLRILPKRVFLVSFHFQFIQDPSALPQGSRFHPTPPGPLPPE